MKNQWILIKFFFLYSLNHLIIIWYNHICLMIWTVLNSQVSDVAHGPLVFYTCMIFRNWNLVRLIPIVCNKLTLIDDGLRWIWFYSKILSCIGCQFVCSAFQEIEWSSQNPPQPQVSLSCTGRRKKDPPTQTDSTWTGKYLSHR